MNTANYDILSRTNHRNVPGVLVTPEDVALNERTVQMQDKSISNSTIESIPYGYCHCGCGERTRIAKYSAQRDGYVKGEPVKFLQGHRLRTSGEGPNPSGICKCGCGGKTSLAERSNKALGHVIGRPVDYIIGHRQRSPRPQGYDPIWNDKEQCYLIPIGVDSFTKVSASDIDKVRGFIWRSSRGYVTTTIQGRSVRIHRLITDAPRHLVVDHINGDTLDNRRENLRACTNSENMMNRRGANKGSRSRFLGVSWNNTSGKWDAHISVDGVKRHLGTFSTEEDAAKCRDRASVEYFGEFASLNFPELQEATR